MKKSTFIRKIVVIFLMVFLTIPAFLVSAQNVIDASTHSTTHSSQARGFWFTAPCDFVITGVRAPTDFSTNAQTIHLVKFASVPPNYSSTTTAFTTLYYGSNLTDTCFVDMNLQIQSGDIIGILAVRDNGSGNCQTSYSAAVSPYTSSLGPYNITLARLGFQGNIISGPATNLWTESGLSIGRAEIRYEIAESQIPIPPHGSPYTGNYSRGYWFTAPCDMVLTGVRAPVDFSTNPQSIHMVKFPSAPATYPATSTSFTTLFYGANITDTGYVDVHVPVNAGDVIGILAVRDNGLGSASTSYPSSSGPVNSTVGSHSITLQRLGWQGNIISSPAANFWTELSNIGRVDLRFGYPAKYKFDKLTTIANTIPFNTPSTGSNKRQWIYHPSDFTCAPPGYISKIYLKSETPVSSPYTDLLIRMGTTSLSIFSSTNFISALDTVYYAANTILSSFGGNLVPITLDKPFFYDGTSNIIVEASHQGYLFGFSIMQASVLSRSLFGNSGSSSATIQGRLAYLGFEMINTLDAGLDAFAATPACEGTFPIFVTLKNHSPVALTDAAIDWKVNTTVKPSVNWSGTLLPNTSTSVMLGNHTFVPSVNYNVEAFVKDPNNLPDILNSNDTIRMLNITVSALPDVNLGNDTNLVSGANIVLDAGSGYTSYSWSNSATTQTITVDTTGHGFGVQTFWVEVTDANGCVGSDTININFIDDTGIDDALTQVSVQISPNPNSGKFDLSMQQFPVGNYLIAVHSLDGTKVYEKSISLTVNEYANTFDLPGLANGLYLLKITGKKGIFTEKLIIRE